VPPYVVRGLRSSKPSPTRIRTPGQKRLQLSHGAQPIFPINRSPPSATISNPASIWLRSLESELGTTACSSVGSTIASTMYRSRPIPSTQDGTAQLLNAPFGPPLVIALGAIVICIAAVEFGRAYTATFLKDLSLGAVRAEVRQWVERVGRMGLAARGVVFAMIGIFLIQASLQQDAGQAVGLGGALQKIAEQPFGQILLGVVAVGLCMYGLFSLVQARYGRLKH
jgi:hypothetical protein